MVHRLAGLVSAPDDTGTVQTRGTADVSYPRSWSRKTDSGGLAPHLSTIDGIVLGAQLVEHHLTHVLGVSEADLRVAWLVSVAVRAGTRPVEDMTSIPASCTCRRDEQRVDCQCRIGSLVVDLVVQLPQLPAAVGDGTGGSRPRRAGLYGGGYRGYRFDSYVLDVDVDARAASARHVAIARPTVTLDGLDAGYVPSLTHMDLLRLSAQTAQILIYAIDGVERSEADTLWMRRARFEASAPRRPIDSPIDATLRVVREQTLDRGGQRWRMYDVAIEGVPHMSANASLAYAVPEGLAPASSAARLTGGRQALRGG